MGAGYTYKCDNCGYSVSTSGPWEFYRDSKGNRKPYGHPVPTCEEAKERGIYGFSADVYCPKCDRIFDVVLVEFTAPTRDYFLAWGGWGEMEAVFGQKGSLECPECHAANLIWDTKTAREVACPRCREGMLKGEMTWMA